MVPSTELNYFIEVANSQNLSRAADKLGISQPSLSLAIKRLEKNLGVPILIRHKRGVTLTQAGIAILAYAKKTSQDWAEIRANSHDARVEVQGKYVLGCHPSLGLRYLSQFLPTILNKYSSLQIQLVHEISKKITERVIQSSVDLGIVVNPVQHPDLIIKKLDNDVVTFWQAKQNKMKPHDTTIICDPELTQHQWLLKELNKKKLSYSRILATSNLEIIANLTANGGGIGILPRSVALATQGDKLKPLSNMPSYHDEICLIYRHENRHIKALQVLMEGLKKVIL